MIKNTLIVTVGIGTLLISNYLGHVFPPFSMDWTPILLGLITGLVFFISDFQLSLKFGLITGIIISNDILIKLFAGGSHDWEGLGFQIVDLFLGLFISFSLIVTYCFTEKKRRIKKYILYSLVSGALIFIYLECFETLGMTWINYPTKDINLSKSKGLFISNINLIDSFITNDIDTFKISQGWIEKQTRTNHLGLFRKSEITNNNYCTLIFKGDFRKDTSDNKILFKQDCKNSVGYHDLAKSVVLTIDNQESEVSLDFYSQKEGNWLKFKNIKIGTASNK